MYRIGVIAGSGMYEIPGLNITEEREVKTPYGLPSAPLMLGNFDGVQVVFLARHGLKHSKPPHKINYRANLWALREVDALRVISITATGGMAEGYDPGSIVLLDQVMDFTQGARVGTFFDGDEVVHVDFTEPYCAEMRTLLAQGAANAKVEVINNGTYLCVNGPRLESRSEINFFASTGAHVVGMTGMPEAALARELELCFAGISVVTNHAAGLTGHKLTTDEVVANMSAATQRLKALLSSSIILLSQERACDCKDALKGSSL